MRKKILAIMLTTLLCALSSFECFAATDLPINYENKYIFTQVGGGIYEYTVPFTGNYTITLAGASGARWGDSSGGEGYTFVKVVRLQAGDTITVSLPNSPSCNTEVAPMQVPGGEKAQLWYNNSLVQEAAGGSGALTNNIAPNGVSQVQVWDGDNLSYRVLNVHWHNNCGLAHPHDWRYTTSRGCQHMDECKCDADSYLICRRCSHSHAYHYSDITPDGMPCINPTKGKHCRLNHYVEVQCIHPACGKKNGQILGAGVFNPGNSYYANGWQPDLASQSNTGSALFKIELNNQEGVLYQGGAVHLPEYQRVKCNLILKGNTVTYFKRW